MTHLSPEEQRLLDHAAAAPMLDQVQRWAAINSGSRNLPGLAQMASLLADAFSVLPGDLLLVDPAPVESVTPEGRVQPLAHGQHLLLSVRPDAQRRLLLTGHMDTVFPADHSFQTQRWLEPGVLNGPGVADMKGGLAVMLAALAAMEASDASNAWGYDVVINSDEEVGSASSAALLRARAAGKIAAFTYEPALPDGTLAGARAGSGNFSIIVTGRSAHAGRNPEEGRNALLAAADLALRLKAASGAGFSCNPAKIDGGGPNNVVPDHAVLRVNFRPRTPADEQAARALIDGAMADVARDHDVTLHLHGGFGRPPKPMDAKAEHLFDLVRQCGADLGLPIGWRDTGGVCDGNNIAACGVPVVDTMGVRGGSIHSDAEFLLTDSLAERARLSALALWRIARGQFQPGQERG
ncbi:hydrolase [Sphingobium naphthae]|uniref:Hydrolase n=1 Tax=Sphingobium naphthae TaxID=1886786 RepID=A0ABU3ZSS1_9SPHN|nr:hydrolase [Sphingobium naphthae]MDV5822573.1 hydrolase [Sphingobium naphthae]